MSHPLPTLERDTTGESHNSDQHAAEINPAGDVLVYFEKHSIRQTMEMLLQDLAETLPDEPWAFLEEKVATHIPVLNKNRNKNKFSR